MRVILELKKEPKEGDLLVFNGKDWEGLDKTTITRPLETLIRKSVKEQNDKIDNLYKQVDKRLEKYHNILQNITKEE